MGKAKMPKAPAAAAPPPDPNSNEEAKAAAGEAKMRSERRTRSGSMGGTLAGGAEGVLGAAPVSKPGLKSTLGGG